MPRFLFVVPPLAAHVHPTAAVGAALRDAGHDVAWVAHREQVAGMLPEWANIVEVGEDSLDPVGRRDWARSFEERREHLRSVAAFRFLWEDFLIPLSLSMATGIATAIDAFAPDVVIVDQHTPAGAVVAQQRGVVWASMAIMSAELVNPLPDVLRRWLDQQLDGLALAIDPTTGLRGSALQFSDDLVVACTTRALVGQHDFPDHYVFVGPTLMARPGEFDWAALDPDRKHVLVTLGTVNSAIGERFVATAIEALEPHSDRVQLIVVVPQELSVEVAPGTIVASWVPYLALLPKLDAIVCHSGHTTVVEALAHAVPLVLAPIRDDHPVVANQVAAAGAGIQVRFGRVRGGELRAAVEAVLYEPQYRESARRIADSFEAAGGAVAAGDALIRLAGHEG